MAWILLGASRGLGRAFAEELRKKNPVEKVLIASRSSDWKMDFADKDRWSEYVAQIGEHSASRIIYFAGGGPFGDFSTKNWRDHEWAFKVNFEFPAFLIHQLAQASPKNLQQLVFVGSAIAESKADPGAASYSAGKHALSGLVKSILAEKRLSFELRLFSPGYMDTNMLPANAWPRQRLGLVKDTAEIASQLHSWLLDDSNAKPHLVLHSDS